MRDKSREIFPTLTLSWRHPGSAAGTGAKRPAGGMRREPGPESGRRRAAAARRVRSRAHRRRQQPPHPAVLAQRPAMLMPRLSMRKSSPRESKGSDWHRDGYLRRRRQSQVRHQGGEHVAAQRAGPADDPADQLVDPAALKFGLFKRDVRRARKPGSSVLSGQASQIHAEQLPAELAGPTVGRAEGR